MISHCVIGGGIAGCFTAMQLLKRNKHFVLLEQSKKPHSKVESVKIKEGELLEMGASIFHTNQTHLLSLMEDVGLKQNIIPLGEKLDIFIPSSISHKLALPSSDEISKRFQELRARLQQAACLQPATSSLTMEELSRQIFEHDEFVFLQTYWAAWFENNQMNARVFFKAEMREGTYCKLKGGLKSIIQACWDRCKDQLHTDCQVISVKQVQVHHEMLFRVRYLEGGLTIRQLFCKHLHMCVSLEQLNSIVYVNHNMDASMLQYQTYATSLSSMRFFVLLKQPVRDLSRSIVSDHLCKWILQLSPTVWMVYVDGELADRLHTLSDEAIVEDCLTVLNKACHVHLTREDVHRTIRAYWKHAFEVLNPHYFSDPRTRNIDLRLVPFHCTSLPTPEGQAWMEGHLYLDKGKGTLDKG